ncbi:MAG: hypothetical protein J3K34DRAFT_512342 [Monoraphidium minutum]|nr:MAG: hypothetical protein J3K34DRAFT_512342 [Monoraphidium minutum]
MSWDEDDWTLGGLDASKPGWEPRAAPAGAAFVDNSDLLQASPSAADANTNNLSFERNHSLDLNAWAPASMECTSPRLGGSLTRQAPATAPAVSPQPAPEWGSWLWQASAPPPRLRLYPSGSLNGHQPAAASAAATAAAVAEAAAAAAGPLRAGPDAGAGTGAAGGRRPSDGQLSASALPLQPAHPLARAMSADRAPAGEEGGEEEEVQQRLQQEQQRRQRQRGLQQQQQAGLAAAQGPGQPSAMAPPRQQPPKQPLTIRVGPPPPQQQRGPQQEQQPPPPPRPQEIAAAAAAAAPPPARPQLVFRQQPPPPWLKAGELVWGKMTMFPWWPCLVLAADDPAIPPAARGAGGGGGRAPVRFFGPGAEVALMELRNLSPWKHAQAAERAGRSKAAAFVRAVAEARAYAAGGALPEAFAAPAGHLYGEEPPQEPSEDGEPEAAPAARQQQQEPEPPRPKAPRASGRRHKAAPKVREPIKGAPGARSGARGGSHGAAGGGGQPAARRTPAAAAAAGKQQPKR